MHRERVLPRPARWADKLWFGMRPAAIAWALPVCSMAAAWHRWQNKAFWPAADGANWRDCWRVSRNLKRWRAAPIWPGQTNRLEERREGIEGDSTCRTGWSQDASTKKINQSYAI